MRRIETRTQKAVPGLLNPRGTTLDPEPKKEIIPIDLKPRTRTSKLLDLIEDASQDQSSVSSQLSDPLLSDGNEDKGCYTAYLLPRDSIQDDNKTLCQKIELETQLMEESYRMSEYSKRSFAAKIEKHDRQNLKIPLNTNKENELDYLKLPVV